MAYSIKIKRRRLSINKNELKQREVSLQKALNEKEEELRLILFKEEETLKEKEKNLWLERED